MHNLLAVHLFESAENGMNGGLHFLRLEFVFCLYFIIELTTFQ